MKNNDVIEKGNFRYLFFSFLVLFF